MTQVNNEKTDLFGLHVKLSGVIRQSIQELKKYSHEKGYVIDMLDYHSPVDGYCHVCLAGVLIAGILDAPIECTLYPNCYNVRVANKLYAIDLIRQGLIHDAVRVFNCSPYAGPTGYSEFCDTFKSMVREHCLNIADPQGHGIPGDVELDTFIDALEFAANGLEKFGL